MSFGRLMLLLSLGSAVHYGPRAMSVLPAEPQMETAPVVSAELLQMLRQAGQAASDASEPQGELADDLRQIRAAGQGQSPVLDNLMRTLQQKRRHTATLSDRARGFWLLAQKGYRALGPKVSAWLWIVPFGVLTLGFAAMAFSQAAYARWAAELGCGGSRLWLGAVSWAIVGLAVATKMNPWPLIPNELILPPIAWLAGSACLMRLVDMNHPVWNSLLRGCMYPLLSMAFVVGFQRFS